MLQISDMSGNCVTLLVYGQTYGRSHRWDALKEAEEICVWHGDFCWKCSFKFIEITLGNVRHFKITFIV